MTRAGFSPALWALLMVSASASAMDLAASMSLESSKVLPSGARNPRFVNAFMAGASRFNGGGQSEPLGTPLNKVVRWSDVISAQTNETDKSMIRSTLDSAQLDANGSPGSTTGQVNTFVDVKVPVLAVGLSERLTLGVAVPIVTANVSADTGFNRSNDGQRWTDELCSLSIDQCNTAANKLNNSINEKLVQYGYQPIQSKRVSNVGDIQVVGKYLLHSQTRHKLAVKTTVVIPTGIRSNPDIALDVPTGDGRLGLGTALVYDQTISQDWRWNSYGGWLGLMPNTITKRIPTAQDDPISRDKETLSQKLRSQVSLGTSISREFASTGLVAGLGYSLQVQSKTRYSGGSQFSSERYSYLEDLTPTQVLHSAVLMAGFSTVEWYQNKKFFYPLQTNLVVSHPLVGRNVSATNVVSGELVLFF